MTAEAAARPAGFLLGLLRAVLPIGVLSALLLVPPGVFYLTSTDSHSTGLAIVAVAIIALLGLQVNARLPTGLFALLFAALAAHLVIAGLLRPIDVQRAALSFALLALVMVAATFLARWFFHQQNVTIAITLEVMRYLLVALAVISLVGWQPTASKFVDKPVFPFTEPSHFALVFVPLVAHACCTSRGLRRYVWLGINLALAVLLQNLSMLVATVLIAAICLPMWLAVTAAFAATSVVGVFDTTYFTDRLDFSAHTTNQSALVYLQGIELAQDAFRRTAGWGVGFQQLGVGVFESPSADALFRLYRVEANLFDGGFLTAKLVSEFGVFGIVLVVLFSVAAIRMALRLRSASLGKIRLDNAETYASAIFVCYTIDFFVRGLGYFSASTTLFIASLIFLYDKRHEGTRDAAYRVRARA